MEDDRDFRCIDDERRLFREVELGDFRAWQLGPPRLGRLGRMVLAAGLIVLVAAMVLVGLGRH